MRRVEGGKATSKGICTLSVKWLMTSSAAAAVGNIVKSQATLLKIIEGMLKNIASDCRVIGEKTRPLD